TYADERAVEILNGPLASFHADTFDRRKLVQRPSRRRRDHQDVGRTSRNERLNLPLADRKRTDHDDATARELQRQGKSERHAHASPVANSDTSGEASAFSRPDLEPASSTLQWMPHSFAVSCSHHQRPARSGSPGRMGRVHGAQPIDAYPLSNSSW